MQKLQVCFLPQPGLNPKHQKRKFPGSRIHADWWPGHRGLLSLEPADLEPALH